VRNVNEGARATGEARRAYSGYLGFVDNRWFPADSEVEWPIEWPRSFHFNSRFRCLQSVERSARAFHRTWKAAV
jgi:hypothetical protein